MGRLTKATLNALNEQTYSYNRYGNIVAIDTKLNAVTLHAQQPGVNPCTNRIQLESLPGPGCANPASYNVVGTYDAAGNVLSLECNVFEYDILNTTISSTVSGVRRIHIYSAGGERVASVTMTSGVPLRWDWTLRDTSSRVLRRLSFQGNIWRWEEDYNQKAFTMLGGTLTHEGKHELQSAVVGLQGRPSLLSLLHYELQAYTLEKSYYQGLGQGAMAPDPTKGAWESAITACQQVGCDP